MHERDAFPLELRQETNAMVAKLLIPLKDGIPARFHWIPLLQEPEVYKDRLEEIFGKSTEEIIQLYLQKPALP